MGIYSSQMSPDLLWAVIPVVCCYGEKKVTNFINLTSLKNTVTEEVESESRLKSSTVRRRLHHQEFYSTRSLVCIPLNRRQTSARLRWAGEHVIGTDSNGHLLFTDEPGFTLGSDSSRVLLWREKRQHHQSKIVVRHSYRGGGIRESIKVFDSAKTSSPSRILFNKITCVYPS
ncbi:hypothetical protein AVEN_215176-1 [Araneus ventricosus]|uniref:Transposase Tc1-like domain-containing protein n=1 Tax=Araneus ventricosus TaxID=182803 RepID=A0A4Y2FRB3_ARAVE|nr:hypothetical protein AVEN_215176-1 [Araneus ventricosus]